MKDVVSIFKTGFGVLFLCLLVLAIGLDIASPHFVRAEDYSYEFGKRVNVRVLGDGSYSVGFLISSIFLIPALIQRVVIGRAVGPVIGYSILAASFFLYAFAKISFSGNANASYLTILAVVLAWRLLFWKRGSEF